MVNWNTKLIAASLLGCAVATGCGNANKKTVAAQKQAAMTPPMNQAALDVPAAPPAAAPAAPAVAFNPTPPQQPVVYDPATEQQPAVEEPTAEAYEPADFDERPVARSRPARKPAAARVASASTGKTKYKVRKGESLWSIAEARYGNGHKWKAIAAANPKIDPNRVQAGQTITLP